MTKQQIICDKLAADGWRAHRNQFKAYAVCFYKNFDTPTRCRCNEDKPGMQIELQVSLHVSQYGEHHSIQLELCGQLADGTWIRIQNYSLPYDLDKVLALIPRMLKVWEASNA